jgi:CheY-like chemotaxis protein
MPSLAVSDVSTKPVPLLNKRICVLDDDFNHLELIRAFLSPTGVQLHTFANGPDALSFLKDNDVDLILSDVMMPGMDGWYFFGQVRSMPRTANTPVIFVTCLLHQTEEELFNDKGDNCITLSKPIRLNDLLKAIEEFI